MPTKSIQRQGPRQQPTAPCPGIPQETINLRLTCTRWQCVPGVVTGTKREISGVDLCLTLKISLQPTKVA